MTSNHLILCHPLLLLPSIFPSIRVFSKESLLCIRWSKYWSFSFSISPSNEYSGLISFRIDWFDLLAVQRTLKSFLQHHSSKALILRHFLYGPNLTSIYDYWKNHSFDYTDLCQQSDVSSFKYTVYICHNFSSKKLFFFLSWLQSSSGVILEPKKIKYVTVSIFLIHARRPLKTNKEIFIGVEGSEICHPKYASLS